MKQKQTLKTKNFSKGLVLLCMLTVLLAGCANQDDTSTETTQSTPESETPDSDLETPDAPDVENLSLNTESQSIPELEPELPASSDIEDVSLDSANLDCTIVQLVENGAIGRPTISYKAEDGGEVAEVSVSDENDGTEITIKYTDDTIFQIAEIDRYTYDVQFLDGTKENVKKDESAYAWGVYSGTELTADRVVIVRYK